MQVVRQVIVPFQRYCCCIQQMGHSKRLQNEYRYKLTLPLLIRNNMNLPLTSVSQSSNLEFIIEIGSNVGLSSDDVRNAVNAVPELLHAAPNQWKQCLSLLLNYGFSCKDCLSMVTDHPKLLVTNKDKLTTSLMHWRNSQLGDKNLLSLLKCNPHFLCIDGKEINKRIPLLQSLTSSKKVTILLKNSPDLMFQNWKDIQSKVTYLQDVMKIEEMEIVKSAALSLTTDDLMSRHMFLERSGSFIPMKPTALPDEPNTNPKLSQITDTSDKSFATKVAGLTLEEFEVFQDLFAAERQRTIDRSDHSDSDDEE